jgi:hypothetical protein
VARCSTSLIPEDDELAWQGDARISGRAREITDVAERSRFTDTPPHAYPLFVLDVERVVRIKLEGSPPHLLIQTWRPDRPVERTFAD